MQINEETLRLVLGLCDSAENAIRMKLILQEVLRLHGIDWEWECAALEGDEDFQRGLAVLLVPLRENREVLLKLLKAEADGSVPKRNDRVQ